MAIVGLVLVWIVIFLVFVLVKKWHMIKLSYQIPGPKGYPIIGNALMFWGKPKEVLMRLYKISQTYRELVGLWMGPKLVVAVYNPKDAEIILRTTKILDKADEYRFIRDWLGDSLLLSSGMKFRRIKKLIMPNFHANILKQYIEVFNEGAKKLVVNVQKEVGKEEFDLQNYFYNNMLSTLLETSMGISHETFPSEKIISYGIAVSEICKIIHHRVYKAWLHFDTIFNFSKYKEKLQNAIQVVKPMTEEVIQKRKHEIKSKPANYETGENTKKRSVLLDLLLQNSEDGQGMTDKEILDEVSTIMFAGQDTTSVSMGFVLSMLGIYPDIQEKVYDEIHEIFGDSDRPAKYEDLQRMEYMERVIQETWRLYPPIPLIGRRATQDVQLTSCTLPANCTVGIIIMLLHRDPTQYPRPHKFNPDNFLPERIKERHPCSFIPFSAGYRTCIGSKYAMLNIKVVLSTIIRNYKVTSNRKPASFGLVAETTLKRREGFLVAFHKRDNAPLLSNTPNQEKTLQPEYTYKDINHNNCDFSFKKNSVKTSC